MKLYEDGTIELNNKSCEMIADDIHAWIKENYPGRDCAIEVSEDNENGCRNYYSKWEYNVIKQKPQKLN